MRTADANITSIFNAVEFTEDNLKEEITIADIADAVFYSLYHFCRMFNKIIHHRPYDYLMRRRLSESAKDLIKTDQKIIEVAFDYQFNSPETYARAFKRMFGIQPNQWKKQGKLPKRFLMPRLTYEHIQHINQGEYLRPVLEEKNAFHVAGLMSLVKIDKNVIPQLWNMLTQELERLEKTMPSQKYYGIAYYPNDWEKHRFFYMAAIEVESPNIIGSPLVVKTIPALKYARFIHKGFSKDLHLSLDYIYHTWFPKSGKSLVCPLEIECYRQDFRGSDHEEAEREIYIPIK